MVGTRSPSHDANRLSLHARLPTRVGGLPRRPSPDFRVVPKHGCTDTQLSIVCCTLLRPTCPVIRFEALRVPPATTTSNPFKGIRRAAPSLPHSALSGGVPLGCGSGGRS